LLVSAGYKSKTTWNIINSESGNANNNNHIPRLFKLGNKNIHLGLAAEAFNKYFLNPADELNMEYLNIEFAISYLRNRFPGGFPEMETIPITDYEITSTVASLKSKNSSGYDGILKKKMLKLSAEYLGRPLVHIHNRLLALGKFPDHFNYTVVNPLFKTHEKSLLCNYRPISQMAFSKIF